MSFPNQDYMTMLKGKQPIYPVYQQPPSPFPFLNYMQQQQFLPKPPNFPFLPTQQLLPNQQPGPWNYMLPHYMPYQFMMMTPPFTPLTPQMPNMTTVGPPARPPQPTPPAEQVTASTHDPNNFVEVSGTKIWLNLKLLRQLGTPESSSDESILNYDKYRFRYSPSKTGPKPVTKSIAKIPLKHFFNIRRRRGIMRPGITTRNTKAAEPEQTPMRRIFWKNDGYIRVGKAYQCQISRRPINLSMVKQKLRYQKVWDHKNREIFDKLKEMLELPDQRVVQLLNHFTNHQILYQKLKEKCPITLAEVQNLLLPLSK